MDYSASSGQMCVPACIRFVWMPTTVPTNNILMSAGSVSMSRDAMFTLDLQAAAKWFILPHFLQTSL